jgi:hypothetical protein
LFTGFAAYLQCPVAKGSGLIVLSRRQDAESGKQIRSGGGKGKAGEAHLESEQAGGRSGDNRDGTIDAAGPGNLTRWVGR